MFSKGALIEYKISIMTFFFRTFFHQTTHNLKSTFSSSQLCVNSLNPLCNQYTSSSGAYYGKTKSYKNKWDALSCKEKKEPFFCWRNRINDSKRKWNPRFCERCVFFYRCKLEKIHDASLISTQLWLSNKLCAFQLYRLHFGILIHRWFVRVWN